MVEIGYVFKHNRVRFSIFRAGTKAGRSHIWAGAKPVHCVIRRGAQMGCETGIKTGATRVRKGVCYTGAERVQRDVLAHADTARLATGSRTAASSAGAFGGF